MSHEPLLLKQPHPDGQKAYWVRVQFPEQRQPLCRLKVEITIDEPILTAVENHPILHEFSEQIDAQIPVYSLTEITAEKFRALLQSKERLHERGWGASRVCRDYYDLWNLLRVPGVKSPDLLPLLAKKCVVRRVTYTSPNDFFYGRPVGCSQRGVGTAVINLCARCSSGSGTFTAGKITDFLCVGIRA